MRARTITSMFVLLICVPASAGVVITENVVYGHKDGMALVYNIIKPEKQNGAGIVQMMSAGWRSMWMPGEEQAKWFSSLTDAGYTVFCVCHGSAPRYRAPDAYADVSRAVRHIRMHAESVGVDPMRLGVSGGSAGGHLALMVGVNSDRGNPEDPDPVMQSSNRVAAVVAYCPPVDIRPVVGGPVDQVPALDFPREQAPAISPILLVSRDDPPALLIHGDLDKGVPVRNSEAMHEVFRDRGATSELLVIEGAGHGFSGDHGIQAEQAKLAWFDKHLIGKASRIPKTSAEQVKKALDDYIAAIKALDIDKMVDAFSDRFVSSEGTGKSALSSRFEELLSRGVYDFMEVNTEKSRIEVDGNSATAKPVIHRALFSSRAYEYRFGKEGDGNWRIVGRRQLE